MNKPSRKPGNPNFSSGPCAKRPGWTYQNLSTTVLGRSHRASIGKSMLHEVIAMSRRLLELPDDYLIGIVPGSDTGAVEMALWNFLTGDVTARNGVDVFAWESFSRQWLVDIVKQLKLPRARAFEAPFGELPDLSSAGFDGDVVFTWNGTTSGVCVPDAAWIPSSRAGLTICDATSAVFAMNIDWTKIDVATYSWQKSMGGEAAHGMLILSPRAVQRLESDPPLVAIPKVFQLLKKGKLDYEIFKGSTINTPSMMCTADALDALQWMSDTGGLTVMIRRSQESFTAIRDWVKSSDTFGFLASKPETTSNTSVCLKIIDPWFCGLDATRQTEVVSDIVKRLEAEKVAFDINAYRDAPPGLRIWCGPTVEPEDVCLLLPWIDWSYEITRTNQNV